MRIGNLSKKGTYSIILAIVIIGILLTTSLLVFTSKPVQVQAATGGSEETGGTGGDGGGGGGGGGDDDYTCKSTGNSCNPNNDVYCCDEEKNDNIDYCDKQDGSYSHCCEYPDSWVEQTSSCETGELGAPCDNTKDCKYDYACDPDTNECVECTSDSHCESGTCDTDTHTCLPACEKRYDNKCDTTFDDTPGGCTYTCSDFPSCDLGHSDTCNYGYEEDDAYCFDKNNDNETCQPTPSTCSCSMTTQGEECRDYPNQETGLDTCWNGTSNQYNCQSLDSNQSVGTEVACNDGIDNDCDGLTDSEDPDCAETCDSDSECPTGETCIDGTSGDITINKCVPIRCPDTEPETIFVRAENDQVCNRGHTYTQTFVRSSKRGVFKFNNDWVAFARTDTGDKDYNREMTEQSFCAADYGYNKTLSDSITDYAFSTNKPSDYDSYCSKCSTDSDCGSSKTCVEVCQEGECHNKCVPYQCNKKDIYYNTTHYCPSSLNNDAFVATEGVVNTPYGYGLFLNQPSNFMEYERTESSCSELESTRDVYHYQKSASKPSACEDCTYVNACDDTKDPDSCSGTRDTGDYNSCEINPGDSSYSCRSESKSDGTCSDGIDNDCDGAADWNDTDCCKSEGSSCSSNSQCCNSMCLNSDSGSDYCLGSDGCPEGFTWDAANRECVADTEDVCYPEDETDLVCNPPDSVCESGTPCCEWKTFDGTTYGETGTWSSY